MKKATVLVHSFRRVSSTKQKQEGSSLRIQRDINEKRAEADSLNINHNYELDETASRSEKKTRREFDKFYATIEDKSFYHIILCEKLDRLFRNEDDKHKIKKLVKAGRVEIRTERPRDVYDSSAGSFKKLQYNIMGDIAEFYADYLREERNKAIKEKLENGEFPSQAPIGFRNIARTKNNPSRIVIEKEEAKLVKKLLEIFSTARYSPVQIVEKAKNLGLRSKRGRVLELPSIKYMLRNRFYTGEFEFPHPETGEVKVYKATNYEPIITKDLWERNQKILEKHTIGYSKVTGKAWRYKGILFCAKCGRPLISEIGVRKGYYSKKKKRAVEYKTQYYHCTHGDMVDVKGKKKKCDLLWFQEKEVDDQILEQIDCLEFDGELWEKIKKQLFEIEGKEVINYEIKQLHSEETKLDNQLELLWEDWKERKVDERFWNDKQMKIRARQEEIKGRLEELEEEREFWQDKVGKIIRIIDGIKNFKEKFLSFKKEKDGAEKQSQMLRLMVEKITANSHRIKTKQGHRKDLKDITIHWNEEFQELFEAGLIKKDKEIDHPKWPTPKTLPNGGCCAKLNKTNLLGKNKTIDILFSIN